MGGLEWLNGLRGQPRLWEQKLAKAQTFALTPDQRAPVLVAIFMLGANGQTAADFLEKITSRGSDLDPPAAPPGVLHALSREERAGT
jgi:hypothetical protein